MRGEGGRVIAARLAEEGVVHQMGERGLMHGCAAGAAGAAGSVSAIFFGLDQEVSLPGRSLLDSSAALRTDLKKEKQDG